MPTQCHHPCNPLSKCITKRQKDAKGHDTDHGCRRKSSAVPGSHTAHDGTKCSAVLLFCLHCQRRPKVKKNQRCLQLQQRILIQKNSSNLRRRTEGLNFDEFWEQNAPSHMSSNHNLEGLTCHTQSWEPIRQCKGFCADPQEFPPIFLAFLQIMGYYP